MPVLMPISMNLQSPSLERDFSPEKEVHAVIFTSLVIQTASRDSEIRGFYSPSEILIVNRLLVAKVMVLTLPRVILPSAFLS